MEIGGIILELEEYDLQVRRLEEDGSKFRGY
jgi:hypothetical protein